MSDVAHISIAGNEYELRWPLRNLRWLKAKYSLTLDKVNLTDPDEVVPFILAGLGEARDRLTEDDLYDGIDLGDLLKFSMEFAKVQEGIVGPLTVTKD